MEERRQRGCREGGLNSTWNKETRAHESREGMQTVCAHWQEWRSQFLARMQRSLAHAMMETQETSEFKSHTDKCTHIHVHLHPFSISLDKINLNVPMTQN